MKTKLPNGMHWAEYPKFVRRGGEDVSIGRVAGEADQCVCVLSFVTKPRAHTVNFARELNLDNCAAIVSFLREVVTALDEDGR